MTPLERMARAIWNDRFPEQDWDDDATPKDRERYFNHARAALAAIEVPSEGMNIAAREWSRQKYGKPIGKDASEGCWTVMLRAALEEGP